MSFLDKIKEAKKSTKSCQIVFLQKYKKDTNDLHVFHEGVDDPSFYTNFVRYRLHSNFNIYFYNCQNKEKVYEQYSNINWATYNKKRILFFVDKDFSDILNITYPIDHNIFVTKYYSIENYLVDEFILERVLRELIHVDNYDVIAELKSKFKIEHKIFVNQVRLLIAWIVYHRRQGNKPNLNDIKLSHFFIIDEKLNLKVNKKPTNVKLLTYLDRVTGITTTPNSWKSILLEYKNLISISEPKIYVRGKFELWFFAEFINKIVNVLNDGRVKGDKKFKIKHSLTESNSIELLAPRLDIPEDLNDFLNFCSN